MTALDGAPLARLAVAEGLVLTLAVVALLMTAVHSRRRSRRDDALLTQVHSQLVAHLWGAGRAPERRLRAAVAALPARLWLRLLEEFEPGLAGERHGRLTRLVRDSGITERAEQWCASRSWSRRLRGLRILTIVRDGARVAPDLLHDRHPLVRAQAVEWAAENPDRERIQRLLALLGADGDVPRFAVEDGLIRIGRPVVGPLTRFLDSAQGAALEAGLDVAVRLADPRMLRPALQASRDASAGTRARAAGLAGALGGARAVERLVELLEDPDADVRAAAVRGLAGLEYWPAAGHVATKLRDPAWRVRSEAAAALRDLGPTGALLLNRALSDEDLFARDAARQVLDLPRQHPESVPA